MNLMQAIEARDAAWLPSRRDEAWRYSDLRAAVRAMPPASVEIAAPTGVGPMAGVAVDGEVLMLNGRVQGPVHLDIPEGKPQVLSLRVISHAVQTAHGGALTVKVQPKARLTLIETYEGRGVGYVCDTELTLVVMSGARLERIVVLEEPADAVSVSQAKVVVEPGAHFAQTVVASGARLQRHETQVQHGGGGSTARLDGLYLLDGKRHADITTVLTHGAPDGSTDQLAKGLVRDHARGVFQGRILVEAGADRTDARMGHHALLLNDGAEVDAKPELEIYADEVACAHGNTIGSLDDQALFYMRSRGIPEHEARALLMQAFAFEIVDRIEHDAAREAVRAHVAERLEALA